MTYWRPLQTWKLISMTYIANADLKISSVFIQGDVWQLDYQKQSSLPKTTIERFHSFLGYTKL